MFSNTAYEALYQYLGLELHSQFITAITSEVFFKAMVLIIFGVVFFVTIVKFFSRYMPNTLVSKKQIPLSAFVKVIFCLFLGLALLRVGSTTGVRNYYGDSWNDNPYIKTRYGDVKEKTKVSFIFDLLSRTAEESSAFLGRIVDKIMAKSHSQLGAPNFFYKAIMYSGTATIDDSNLKELVHFYTENCFEKALPLIGEARAKNKLNLFFNQDNGVDRKLSEIEIKTEDGVAYSCLDVKNEVRTSLKQYATSHHVRFINSSGRFVYPIKDEAAQNMHMANMLVNHYMDDKESVMGIMKGSQLPGTTGRVFQYLNRLFSFDAILSLIGFSESHGASEAAVRSQKFSEHLARAPHVAGLIKLALVAIFPFLIFFIVAGKWKVLIYWFAIYFSVLLWTPLWVLFYHIMTSLAQSTEVMQEFGQFSDGISLYGAKLISSRMYYFYSIYSWLQLLVATLTTGSVVFFLRPMLMENNEESAPEFIGGASNTASTATTAVKAVGAVL
ncbi:MAG: hypothetical protein HON90_07130 [Halobacteriovoraceae bacterium]|jgi:hypothetical protein|nr:hypothetical protein [Halobacteriovoraceae bacterium]